MVECVVCRDENREIGKGEMVSSVFRERYALRARVIKALAHPSRLMMVEALASGERCVCELTDLVGSDISTVSKHLSLLKNAGILEDRKAGLWVYYKLRCPCIIEFFKCIEAVIDETNPRHHSKTGG
jgi:DNA-binding transcriptional ArsR family regulator